MSVLWIIVVGAMALAAAWYEQHRRAARRSAIAAEAIRLGRTFRQRDPEGLLHTGFSLFRCGDGRGIDWTVAGPDDLRLLDYWYYDDVSNGDKRQRRYYRFSCAVLQLPDVWMPALSISKETIGSRVKDKVGLRDLEVESDEFNRTWEVVSRDRRFAYAFLDPQMIAWLQMAGTQYRFETIGDRLLVATAQASTEAVFLLEHVVRGLAERMPRVVGELFPKDAP